MGGDARSPGSERTTIAGNSDRPIAERINGDWGCQLRGILSRLRCDTTRASGIAALNGTAGAESRRRSSAGRHRPHVGLETQCGRSKKSSEAACRRLCHGAFDDPPGAAGQRHRFLSVGAVHDPATVPDRGLRTLWTTLGDRNGPLYLRRRFDTLSRPAKPGAKTNVALARTAPESVMLIAPAPIRMRAQPRSHQLPIPTTSMPSRRRPQPERSGPYPDSPPQY
jgi:hypothetical protein